MFDLKLNKGTHDLLLENNDISYTSKDIDWVIQKIKIELQFFFGEWFLDNSLGFQWLEKVLIKNPNLNEVDDMIKLVILKYADSMESYETTLSNRKLTVSASCIYNGESFVLNEGIDLL